VTGKRTEGRNFFFCGLRLAALYRKWDQSTKTGLEVLKQNLSTLLL
jgi:hypothetical protein